MPSTMLPVCAGRLGRPREVEGFPRTWGWREKGGLNSAFSSTRGTWDSPRELSEGRVRLLGYRHGDDMGEEGECLTDKEGLWVALIGGRGPGHGTFMG